MKNEKSANALKEYIEDSSDFSVYTKRSVAAFLDFALEADQAGWTTTEVYVDELYNRHLYRRYFYHDRIHVSENASNILSTCVPAGNFQAIEREVASRHYNEPKPRSGYRLKNMTKTRSSELLQEYILIPHSEGKSVLDAEPEIISVLNNKHETIFDSIRDPCKKEISFNVILLLSNAWKIVYKALENRGNEKRPIPRAVLHKAFVEAKFSEQYYNPRDLLLLQSYCDEVISFITASKSFWDHQKELNPRLEKKEQRIEEITISGQGTKRRLEPTSPQLPKKPCTSQPPSGGQEKPPLDCQAQKENVDDGNVSGSDFSRTRLSFCGIEDEAMVESHDTEDPKLPHNKPRNDPMSSDFEASCINPQSHTTGKPPNARKSSNVENGFGTEIGGEAMGGTKSDETAKSPGMESSGVTDRPDDKEPRIIGPSEEQERPTCKEPETSNDDLAAEELPRVSQPESNKLNKSDFFDGTTPETKNSSVPIQNMVEVNRKLCKLIYYESCDLYVSVLKKSLVDKERGEALLAIREASQAMCKKFKVGSEDNTLPVENFIWSSINTEAAISVMGIVASIGRILSGIESATGELQSELHHWLIDTKTALDASCHGLAYLLPRV